MTNIKEELAYTTKLLLQEWQEDRDQFRNLTYRKSIKDKVMAGMCWYPVDLVKVKWAFSDQLVVEISTTEISEGHGFQSGKSICFFSNSGENDLRSEYVNGVINYVKQNRMTVSLHTGHLPDWINDGKLGVELLFDETSYKVMEKAIKKVMQAENNRLAHLRDILLGNGKPAFSDIPGKTDETLNISQNEALDLIFRAQDMAVVHGPPGTGKTTSLVRAVVAAVTSTPQVMVCAPSNTAVDLLVEKLTEAGLNVLRLGHPSRVEENLIQQTVDAKVLAHPSFKDYKKLKKSGEEFKRNAQKFKRSFGSAEREKRSLQQKEARRCFDEARLLYDYMVQSVLDSSQVIACTLVGSAGSILKGRQFPVVFLDEAAQALEPASWIPLLQADKVVMAGDHCQLPPTIKSRKAAEGLQHTLFEKAISRQPGASSMLSIQYRMPQKIMAFPNELFYGGALAAAPNTSFHYLSASEPVMEFIDTAGSGFLEHQDRETVSIANKEEALMALRLLQSLIRRIGWMQDENQAWQVGLIAPYRAQVRLIRQYLDESEEWLFLKQKMENISINTVDGFQGQEKDIILISLTRSNPQGEIGFLSDTRRMNVALTRAKRKLIVIGDSATIGCHPFYQAFLDHVQVNDCYHSVYEYWDGGQ
ncbi:IGHMBP2 family helicase [Cyclobacterium jeungdonense]|uniref:IGHMBP2 family helicase n=1 Tax=Cyclobacterium jeungdonense TaxID=708087 RepID=A0ABT8C636_9BACT|nr:IGHMBP2 family helicase [Cyclobacterium jeungdonense]MDN3688211.1 IGHMBP2 family helicase [Cyclobacterium jeungdonense]